MSCIKSTNCDVKFVPSVNLPNANSDVLREILLRLPKKDIVKCRQVCQKWKKIIEEKSFWLEKEKFEGETYLKELIGSGKPLLISKYALLSIKKPFNRNLLSNTNPNGLTEVARHIDPRWIMGGMRHGWKYSSPPIFYSNQFHPDFVDLFDECLETTHSWCTKSFDIHIDEIGFTPDVMDNKRPPIIFHEWISHRSDAGCQYRSSIQLFNKNGLEVASTQKEFRFQQWQLQKWEKVELVLSSYPPGVCRIRIMSGGKDTQYWAGHYGCKIAGSHFEIKMEETPSPSSKRCLKRKKIS